MAPRFASRYRYGGPFNDAASLSPLGRFKDAEVPDLAVIDLNLPEETEPKSSI